MILDRSEEQGSIPPPVYQVLTHHVHKIRNGPKCGSSGVDKIKFKSCKCLVINISDYPGHEMAQLVQIFLRGNK